MIKDKKIRPVLPLLDGPEEEKENCMFANSIPQFTNIFDGDQVLIYPGMAYLRSKTTIEDIAELNGGITD